MPYTKQAIKKAVESGWHPSWLPNYPRYWLDDENRIYRVVLDPSFWQALGKALGWNHQSAYCKVGNHKSCWPKNQSCKCFCHPWKALVNYLAEGKDIESYFKELLK